MKQSFAISTPVVAMAQWENRVLLIGGLLIKNHLTVIGFSLQVNFDDVLPILTKISESTIWSSSQPLHQSFRA